MVEIATPITDFFSDPEKAEQIISLSDCLEGRDRYADSNWPNQKLFHFSGSLIWEWDEQEREFIKRTITSNQDLEFITFHLNACYHNPGIVDRMFQPNDRPYTREEMLGRARQNTRWLRTFLKRSILIGVENNNYFPTPAYNIVTDGDFVSEVVEQNDLAFLFDIAHARITAHNRKIPYTEYLRSLPMQRTLQLHLSKHKFEGDLAIDTHDLPDEAVYQEARDLAKRFAIKYVGHEYYQDSSKLIKELKRVRQLQLL